MPCILVCLMVFVTSCSKGHRSSQEYVALSDIKNLSETARLYALDHDGMYPQAMENLLKSVNQPRAYILILPIDPWGNPYHYTPGSGAYFPDYQFFSSGPDGVPGNEDDITFQTVLE